MDTVLREPVDNELEGLRVIWESSFGLDDFDMFMQHYYTPGYCKVVSTGSKIISAGYLVPVGDLVVSGKKYPCAHVYSLATLPEYRGKKFGALVLDALIKCAKKEGFPAIAICPSEDSLFEYYKKNSEFIDWFYVDEQYLEKAPDNCGENIHLKSLSAQEYARKRLELLCEINHMDMNTQAISYQEKLCNFYGGGFFYASFDACSACITVEKQKDGSVHVKELLSAPEHVDDILHAVMKLFPAAQYTVRRPIYDISAAINPRRHAMIHKSNDFSLEQKTSKSWCGFTFD